MNWTPQRKIRLGFLLVAVVPVVIGLLGALSLRELFVNSDILAQTNRTIRQLDQVYIELADLEVAESDYVLTGREQAVERFSSAAARVREDMTELERLTAGDKENQIWKEHLATLLDQKISETRHIIELRRSMGPEAAADLRAALGRGASTLDDIRSSIRRIRTAEQRELDQRMDEQSQNRMSILTLFIVVLALNVALVYSLWWMIHREAEEAKREEARMRELAADLERRVEQRTEALKRSNEDLQQFAYVVSHDLQEPLRMVGTYSELLRRRYQGKLGEDADEYIHFAVDGVKRMTTLIRDLLEYSRAGEAQDKEPEPVDANEVLETVLLNLQARIEDAGAMVTHDRLPVVVTHRIWFTQLLQNLVGNALKYRSERRPEVHVSARQEKTETVFMVRDNGIGIDPKYKEQVFGIFKRLHGRDVEGTGIGLAMCKKIVERAGGRIWFDSEPGEGSTFFFTLPHRTVAPIAQAKAS